MSTTRLGQNIPQNVVF